MFRKQNHMNLGGKIFSEQQQESF